MLVNNLICFCSDFYKLGIIILNVILHFFMQIVFHKWILNYIYTQLTSAACLHRIS